MTVDRAIFLAEEQGKLIGAIKALDEINTRWYDDRVSVQIQRAIMMLKESYALGNRRVGLERYDLVDD